MKTVTNFLFFGSIFFFPLSFLLRLMDVTGYAISLAIGLFGVVVFFFARIIKRAIKNGYDHRYLYYSLLILVCPVFFSKYLFHDFGDKIGLFIIPVFFIFSLIYLYYLSREDLKTTIVTGIFLLMVFPLFIPSFPNAPIQYLPNPIKENNGNEERMNYEFKKEKTRQLVAKAEELSKKGDFMNSFMVYKKAQRIEPKNPFILMDLGLLHLNFKKGEKAIEYLNKAISIDPDFYPFYINRGRAFFKNEMHAESKEDYRQAIKINPKRPVAYLNLAEVYYFQDSTEKACSLFKKSKERGLIKLEKMSKKRLNRIEQTLCK